MEKQLKLKEPQYFYVKNDSNVYPISINDINKIALIATMFEPLPAETKVEGYFQVLELYFERCETLREDYYRLISQEEGKAFLATVIVLTLLEQKFRCDNIRNLEQFSEYNDFANEYQKQIAINNEDYELTEDVKPGK